VIGDIGDVMLSLASVELLFSLQQSSVSIKRHKNPNMTHEYILYPFVCCPYLNRGRAQGRHYRRGETCSVAERRNPLVTFAGPQARCLAAS
jgi:hypothetical protein